MNQEQDARYARDNLKAVALDLLGLTEILLRPENDDNQITLEPDCQRYSDALLY